MAKLRKRGLVTLLQLTAVAAVFFLVCTAAWASPEDESDFFMTCPGVRMLTLDPDTLNFQPGLDQILAGWTQDDVIVAKASANVTWVLTIRGSAEAWEGPWDKPVSDIWWKYDGGQYQPLSTSVTEIVSGGPVNQHAYPVHFKVKLDIEKDVPGDYYYSYIIFELASP
jgi:hypothetical protein